MQTTDNQQYNGGVNYLIFNGKHSISLRYSQKYNVVNVLKKQTMQKANLHTYQRLHLTMEWTDLLVMKVA